MRNKLIAGLALLAAILTSAGAASADNYMIALPKDMPGQRADIETLISKAFFATRPGDTLSVYDAPERRRLAAIAVPDEEAYNNLRLKRNMFGGELRSLQPFLAGLDEAAPLPANIFLPQLLRELAGSALPALPGKTAELLVVGSAKYHDDREPQFTMLEGHFPSDGFLLGDDNASPFGVRNRRGSLAGVNVHFCFTDADWINDAHRQRVERFWSLYVKELGGKLATFTPDLDVCAQRFVEKVTQTAEDFTVDPEQTKPEMLRIVRDANREDVPAPGAALEDGARFMENDVALSDDAPQRRVGLAKVGIRWACGGCDVDLYARASPDEKFLYFAHQVSGEGRHNKDWRNSPDAEKQYEYIDFTAPIDLGKLEIYLHFYRGEQAGGVPGEIRLWFDGQVYEQPFHIAASRGNGRVYRRPDQSKLGAEWVKVDLEALARAYPPSGADG